MIDRCIFFSDLLLIDIRDEKFIILIPLLLINLTNNLLLLRLFCLNFNNLSIKMRYEHLPDLDR